MCQKHSSGNTNNTTVVDFRFINTEYLESVSGGDKEVIRELVDIFKAQAVEFASEMKTLLAKKEYLSLGLLAHKAKSSIAVLGMTDLASMLKTFELDAKAGNDTGNYEGYVARFEHDTNEAISELEWYVNNL